jgi:hypothetical protein
MAARGKPADQNSGFSRGAVVDASLSLVLEENPAAGSLSRCSWNSVRYRAHFSRRYFVFCSRLPQLTSFPGNIRSGSLV